MAEQVPYQTGSDLLSYHGDPNLAVGSGAAGPAVAFNGQQLSGVLGQMQEQEAQVQLTKYKNKLQDQENLAKMLSGQDGSVFNMKDPKTGKDLSFSPLPDDQKILLQKAHDLRKTVMSNPDGYMYDPDFLDQQNEFKALQRQASLRAVHVADQQQEMTKVDNDTDRQGYQDHINDVRKSKLTDFGQLDPYLPDLKTDLSKVYDGDKDLMETNKTMTVDNGVGYEVSTTKPNIDKLDVRSKLLSDKTARDNANTVVKQFLKSPLSQDPAVLAKHNEDVIAANQRLGLTPDNPHYIPTIPLDPNTGLMDPNFIHQPSSANDLFYSLSAPSKAVVRTSKQVSDAALKQQKDKAETRNQNAEADLHEAQSKAAKSGKPLKPTTEELKEDQNRESVKSMYKEVKSAYVIPTNAKPIPDRPYRDEFNKKFNLYPVPKGVAEKFIGIEEEPTSTTIKGIGGSSTVKNITGDSVKPDDVFLAVDKKSGDKQLVFMKDGKTIAKVPEKQAIINGIKHEAKYKPSDYESKTVHVDEIYGNGGKTNEEASTPKAHTGYNKHVTAKGTIYFTDKNGVKYYDDGSGELTQI